MQRASWAILISCLVLWAMTGGCGGPGDDPPADIDAASPSPDSAPQNDADSDAGGVPGAFALDPASLLFYDLPINSVRYAVSGLEPTANMCVTLVWFITEPTGGDYHLCGLDPTPPSLRPYAIVAPVTPAEPPPPDGPQYGAGLCEVWDYGANATVVDVAGCVDFSWSGSGTTGSADLLVTLDSPALQGPVVIRSAP